MKIRTGGCLCGAVAYRVEGEPLRVGLCHCADCRKSSGSAFVFFAVWPRQAFSHNGEIATFAGRSFCAACGSRLFCLRDDEADSAWARSTLRRPTLHPAMKSGSSGVNTGCILCPASANLPRMRT